MELTAYNFNGKFLGNLDTDQTDLDLALEETARSFNLGDKDLITVNGNRTEGYQCEPSFEEDAEEETKYYFKKVFFK